MPPRLDTLLGSLVGDHALAMFARHDLAHEREHRNACPGQSRVRVGDLVRLADHVRTIPAYHGKPALTRASILLVSSISGRGTDRDPHRLTVTDGEHQWHLDATDVALDRRQAAGRGKPPRFRDIAALVALAEQLRAEASTRQGRRREAARKVARFIARFSGAKIDDDATLDFEDNVVVSGHPHEMEKVAAWIERLARLGKLSTISAVVETFDDPDDPDWAVCRIRGLVSNE